MSEDNVTESRIDALKARADVMGITYHPNIGEDKLDEKIKKALADKPAANENTDPVDSSESKYSDSRADKNESSIAQRRRKQREANELVRIQVTCMDPKKRDYSGEIFCAGNRVIGTVKKYVPFDTEYHVPRVIYNMIKNKQCQIFVNKKDDKGRSKKEGKLIKAYNVTVLDPLTQEELTALAQRQAMAKGTAAA